MSDPGAPPPAGAGGAAGPDPGGMAPTTVGFLIGWAIAGLLIGRLARPVVEQFGGTAPVVAWSQPLALVVVAGVLLLAARATHRAVRARIEPLTPDRAVNRLLLGRACALVGALVAGGYVGYAVAWLGSDAVLADQRVLRSGVAALAGVGVVVAALVLERACRVPPTQPPA